MESSCKSWQRNVHDGSLRHNRHWLTENSDTSTATLNFFSNDLKVVRQHLHITCDDAILFTPPGVRLVAFCVVYAALQVVMAVLLLTIPTSMSLITLVAKAKDDHLACATLAMHRAFL